MYHRGRQIPHFWEGRTLNWTPYIEVPNYLGKAGANNSVGITVTMMSCLNIRNIIISLQVKNIECQRKQGEEETRPLHADSYCYFAGTYPFKDSFHKYFCPSIFLSVKNDNYDWLVKYWAWIGLPVKVILCSVCANEANINLNVSHYALDVSMLEVLTLMWVGRERGTRQRRSVGGGWVEVNVHGASQSFLGFTHRMAEIRQNGRLQVLPSAIRIALLSLISRTLSFFPFSCPLMPALPLSFLFFFHCTHFLALTNTLSSSLPLSVFLPPSLLPITSASGKVCASTVLSCCCRLSLYGHIIFDETGRGWRDAANIPPSVSLMAHSFYPIYRVCMCVCLCGWVCICVPEAMIIHQTRTLSGHNHFPLSHCL